MTKTIPLSDGRVTVVDDDDYEWLNQWNWRASAIDTNWSYAVRVVSLKGAPRNKRLFEVSMHRLIADATAGEMVDHINGDTLDNRRCNLRLASNSQNQQNRRRAKGSSQYKGVTWHKKCTKWQAAIKANGKHHHLGLFLSEIEAANAYDVAAKEFFGEFAALNLDAS